MFCDFLDPQSCSVECRQRIQDRAREREKKQRELLVQKERREIKRREKERERKEKEKQAKKDQADKERLEVLAKEATSAKPSVTTIINVEKVSDEVIVEVTENNDVGDEEDDLADEQTKSSCNLPGVKIKYVSKSELKV